MAKIYWLKVDLNDKLEDGDFWANYDLNGPIPISRLINGIYHAPKVEQVHGYWVGKTPSELTIVLRDKGWNGWRPATFMHMHQVLPIPAEVNNDRRLDTDL